MKKLKWFLLAGLIPLFLPVLIIIILMGAVGGGGTNGSPQSQNGVTYADHWSDGDPYTHNLLVHRFGITAEQLDGFLDTLGISYSVLNETIKGKRPITPELAFKIEAATGTKAYIWVELQTQYNYWTAKKSKKLSVLLDQIRKSVAVL